MTGVQTMVNRDYARRMLQGQLNRMVTCETIEEFKDHHDWAKHWMDSYTMETMTRFVTEKDA